MMTTKAISSAAQFLTAVSGKTELFEVEGATVELRALGWEETQQLSATYGENLTEMTFQAVVLGLANPKLDEAQLAQLRMASPGAISEISKRIMRISGMLKEEDGRPLAGTGSPS
jgi:hypothetical protein